MTLLSTCSIATAPKWYVLLALVNDNLSLLDSVKSVEKYLRVELEYAPTYEGVLHCDRRVRLPHSHYRTETKIIGAFTPERRREEPMAEMLG